MADFKAVERNGVHLVTFPDIVDGDEPGFEAMFKTWLLATPDIHVFDMKQTTRFKSTAYRHVLKFNQQLKAHQKKLFCLHIMPALATQLKQDGVTGAFSTLSSLEEAQRLAKPAVSTRPSVDVELINPFVAGTMTVLETQAKIKLTPGKPYLRKLEERLPMEIAGILALSCKEFTGSIALCFTAKSFLAVYEGLVGEKHDVIDQATEDAAAELLNMIFGHAKTVLNDAKGYSLDKALPTVLAGDKLRIHHQSRAPAIVLPFESPVGAFHIEISIERT